MPSQSPVRLYVDDGSLLCVSNSKVFVRYVINKGVSLYSSMFADLEFAVSDKSTVVTSSLPLTHMLKKDFAKSGHQITAAASVRDLGLCFNASAFKSSALRSRVKCASKRFNRIAKLSKSFRSCRGLFRSGAMPQATWGHQNVGVSKSMLAQFRRNAGACSGICQQGRCLMSAIVLAFGPRGDPWHTIIYQTCQTWFNLFFSLSHSERLELSSAWSEIYIKFQGMSVASSLCYKSVNGIVSNMIYVLLPIKWKPLNYDLWIADDSAELPIPHFATSFIPIAHAMQDSASRILWKSTTALIEPSHTPIDCGGMQFRHGFHFQLTTRWLRKLRKEKNYPIAALLETLLTGGCWAPQGLN